MQGDYIELRFWQVALAAALILTSGIVSLALKLGMERRLAVASIRTVVQLLLIGLVLDWIFAVNRWYVVVVMMLVMTFIAGAAAVQQTERRYDGIWLNSLVSIWAASWLILAVALLGIVQPRTWYMPQYAIPLLGMILGNTHAVLLNWSEATGILTGALIVIEVPED